MCLVNCGCACTVQCGGVFRWEEVFLGGGLLSILNNQGES